MDGPGTILVVDDTPQNIRLFEAVLTPRGYKLVSAASGQEALEAAASSRPDLVLLDIMMPGMDGHEVCRRLREDPATSMLPIIMVTASGPQEKLKGLESGADDFVSKPFEVAELLARIKSLLRVKQYHDLIEAQRAELAELNRTLEERVQQQVEELGGLARLRHFLSPQIADLVVHSGDARILENHRREVAVLFCDLRGFTSFSERSEPEEVMGVLAEFHRCLGGLINKYEASVGSFTGDGLMAFLNDPLPCPEPARRGVELALAMQQEVGALCERWAQEGHDLGFGVGVAFGYATLGTVGPEGRLDYAVVGSVVNLASRLCDHAQPGQVLISARTRTSVDDLFDIEPLGELTLKGFSKPVAAFSVRGLAAAESASADRGPPTAD
jgi:class 3 adenylate cyclase